MIKLESVEHNKMYQFDKKIQRRGTNCVKWDYPFIEEDTIPMWIADMDFQVAPSITENLIKAASQEAFGYKFLSEDYYEAVSDWMQRKHGYKVEREEICFVPNVVVGLSLAVQTVCAPGDEIIVQTPVYGPFYNVVRDNNCILKESPLKNWPKSVLDTICILFRMTSTVNLSQRAISIPLYLLCQRKCESFVLSVPHHRRHLTLQVSRRQTALLQTR